MALETVMTETPNACAMSFNVTVVIGLARDFKKTP